MGRRPGRPGSRHRSRASGGRTDLGKLAGLMLPAAFLTGWDSQKGQGGRVTLDVNGNVQRKGTSVWPSFIGRIVALEGEANCSLLLQQGWGQSKVVEGTIISASGLGSTSIFDPLSVIV